MLRFIHIAIVCLLGLALTGVPRLSAANECGRDCAELNVEAGDSGEEGPATPCDAYRSMRLYTQVSCPALPHPAAPASVMRLSLRWSTEGIEAPCSGAPQEVFQPPRQA